ncbi:MAG: glycoside hydrolase family 13 [Desulfobulbaceae bacterium]|nr:MAG: glycoside hydrolase family 13 [Desulfobulbaceae bacterium]
MACKKPGKCAPQTKKNSKRKIASTEFILHAPDAGKVFLTGDFNNWNPEEFSMRKFKNGDHTKKLKLKPGRYEYQFIVDGNWWTDPANPNRISTEFGSENSVIAIGEEVYQQ